MTHPIFKEARLLEEAFFRKRDAALLGEINKREAIQTRKNTLAKVSGIKDEKVLGQLIEHDIHAETLAAFSLVPLIEVAWADGDIPPAERKVLLHAMEEAGIQRDSVAYQIMEQWMERRPEPKLMKLWKNYTQALMGELTPEAQKLIRQTVLEHARAVAEAAGGFLGFGRVSNEENAVLLTLEEAFRIERK